jgi:hypothetical protein
MQLLHFLINHGTQLIQFLDRGTQLVLALCGSSVKGTWRGGSFVGGPEGYERKALGIGISLHGGSAVQLWVGWSTGDFEVWLKRALGLECGSSVKGIWREGFLAGDPERYVEKSLQTGISFHRGSVWGNWKRACLPGNSRAYEGALGMGHLFLRGFGEAVLGRAPSVGTLEGLERYAGCPVNGPPSL